tara:strand:+ start:3254 stop:4090 length:837 start_codon:yes stop_codon:yes gene_type:complete
MFSYIKSFFYSTTGKSKTATSEKQISNEKDLTAIRKNKDLSEKLMIIRHRTKKRLGENNLTWHLPGWSNKLSSHVDWSIKIENKLTTPIIQAETNIGRYISAIDVPINITDTTNISLQKYLENFGQFNSNIKIDYNLSSNYNESVRFTCALVLLPKHLKNKILPCKITHRFKNALHKSLILSSNKSGTGSFIETDRKHIINLEIPKTDNNEINYNICAEIPLIKSQTIPDLYIRDLNRMVTGTLVYYFFVDEDNITEEDFGQIIKVFNNFKTEKYGFN